MTPADFAREIVIPTLEDFRADRTSRRWAYLSATAVYHLRDHLAEVLAPVTGDPKVDRRVVWDVAERVDAAVVAALRSPELLEAVRAAANGSKHAFTRSPRGAAFKAEADRQRWPGIICESAYGLAVLGGGEAGREILHQGKRLDMYRAAVAVLLAFLEAFPEQLGGCTFDSYPEARRPENG